ncbi:MAG: CPBP family intramembrane metalloprotease [Gemmatimonadota bacterium]|nr:MAG: CPBP family intramembrane metalloprotease [Gemmatimonadota bacterium]
MLVFVGFLLDRLAKRWGWAAAVLVNNAGFAVWHYNYLAQGLLLGGAMMFLTFPAGSVISLAHVKTRNTLSAVICHTLVDSPTSVLILLGIGH